MLIADTHILLWELSDKEDVPTVVSGAIQDALASSELAVSTATYWELGELLRKGRVELGEGLRTWRSRLRDSGIHELFIDTEIALRAVELRNQAAPNDAADRFIMATALTRNAVLVTADQEILAWKGPLDCINAT
ncbi:MAG: type II toxin-antitoxin system VapC family toxin [Acidimicrobiia bacterium]|nr:type II toxin-antitoxin system VapC family toxin [Acidimicrobiia bacterium]MCY4432874.1 type II toxin-antitoxin system VapC family toxin [bacterium]